MPTLHADACTDVGRERDDNQDAYVCRPEQGLFAVIDGVGGYAGGDVAARIAQKEITTRFKAKVLDPTEAVVDALHYANAAILEQRDEDLRLAEMACVATVAYVHDEHLYYAHVGDTRLYHLRPGQPLHKLTKDHSLVGLREDAGDLTEEEAMHHPRRNEILYDLGSEPFAPDSDKIERGSSPFAPEDTLLLCSDGLTDLVRQHHIEALLRRHAGNPEACCQALVDAANEAGGTDNITVVVVEGEAVRPSPIPPAPATVDAEAEPAASTHEAGVSLDEPTSSSAEALALPALQWRNMGGVPSIIGLLCMVLIFWSLGWITWDPPASTSSTPRVTPDTISVSDTPALMEALTLEDPKVIHLAPGTYRAPLLVQTPTHLLGDSSGASVILPNPDDSTQQTALRIDSTADVVVRHLAFLPDTVTNRRFHTAIEVRHARATLAHLTVQPTTGPALRVSASPEHTLYLDTLSVRAADSTALVMQLASDSVFVRGGQWGMTGNAPILHVWGTGWPTLQGNTFHTNGGPALQWHPSPGPPLTAWLKTNIFVTTTGDTLASDTQLNLVLPAPQP